LTDRGKDLLEYAQKISRLTDEFHQHLNEDREVSGDVHIVSPDSVCEAMLLDHFADFYSRYPNIRIKFSTADTVDMFRMLDRNEADIMLTLDSHVYQKDYIIAKECQMPTHFVVGTSAPLAQQESISIQELAHHPFILTEKGMGYRGVLDKHLERLSLEIQPVLEISRTDIITRLLENSTAVSYLPDFVTKRWVAQGKLKFLQVEGLEIPPTWQQLIYHKNKWISRALGTFIDYVKEHEFQRS
jgi:DNA-binding transcriptional LysR family regulator